MADERAALTGEEQSIPKGYRWSDLANPKMEGVKLGQVSGSSRPAVGNGFATPLRVRLGCRAGGPSDDDKEHIKDKRCNGYIVEQRRQPAIWAKLVCRPKQKGESQQRRSCPFRTQHAANLLVDDVSEGDQYEGKRRERVVSSTRDKARCRVADQKREHADQSEHAQP